MKLLLEHLKNNREALLHYSEVVGLAKHPVNLGAAREGLISNFIQQNLPEYISYHTGEIFDRKDRRSGQIDIVLHPITSPKISLHSTINIFPAETVLAALEVKSNLTKAKLTEALTSSEKLKKVELIGQRREDRFDIVDPDRVPFIVFAYKGPKLQTLKKHLKSHCEQNSETYRALPDLIVVLDRGYYLLKTPRWMFVGANIDNIYKVKEETDFVLLGIFEFILKLVEYWFVKPSEHTMPIKEYTKDMPSLFDIFKL